MLDSGEIYAVRRWEWCDVRLVHGKLKAELISQPFEESKSAPRIYAYLRALIDTFRNDGPACLDGIESSLGPDSGRTQTRSTWPRTWPQLPQSAKRSAVSMQELLELVRTQTMRALVQLRACAQVLRLHPLAWCGGS